MLLNDKKTVRAWTFYDWANSAYSLIITSAIFPAYYSAIVPEKIIWFGIEFSRSSLASFSISFSFLFIAVLSPILSSIADYKGNKKSFMKFFCYLGASACAAMFFFEKDSAGQPNVVWGLTCSIIASIGYCGSIVFYNAFLPEVASKDRQDEVSAKGFAMGYIGSVLLMLVCFAFIILNEQMAWNLGSLPARISFVLVAIWWLLFAQIPFRTLVETPKESSHKTIDIIRNGYTELRKVWTELRHFPILKKFLASFFFYNMGVQTVMYMATYFASDELKMETTQLLAVVLIIQLVAIGGAWLFAKLSNKAGNQTSLFTLIVIWIGICFAAFVIQTITQFFILAFAVGMVMGGIQSLSRSTYSKLLPPTEDTASYFSFFDVCDKLGIVIGTLSFGMITLIMGGMRNAALGLSVFFIIGLSILLSIRKKEFQLAS